MNGFYKTTIVVLKNLKLKNIVEKIKKFFEIKDIVLLNQTTKKNADIYISLGGDGTFLWAVSLAKDKPVIGFNFGNLGFLANFEYNQLEGVLLKIKNGELKPQKRNRIRLLNCDALNDIAFISKNNKLINFDLKINNFKNIKFKGSGIIFATATGSTADNLYAGGPILIPSLEAIVINPIIPYSLFIKPIVVDINSKITLKLDTNKFNYFVSIDGKIIKDFNKKIKNKITIKKGKDAFIFSNKDVFYNIYNKLSKIIF